MKVPPMTAMKKIAKTTGTKMLTGLGVVFTRVERGEEKENTKSFPLPDPNLPKFISLEEVQNFLQGRQARGTMSTMPLPLSPQSRLPKTGEMDGKLKNLNSK